MSLTRCSENDATKFRFLGRLLGKCIYELCLVDVPFTEFFLAQLLDRPVAGMYAVVYRSMN